MTHLRSPKLMVLTEQCSWWVREPSICSARNRTRFSLLNSLGHEVTIEILVGRLAT